MPSPQAPRLKLLAADDLVDDPNNARVHPEEQVRNLAKTIERFGWTRPLMVDVAGGNILVYGHGARAAAQLIYAEGGTIYAAPGKERGGKELPSGTVPVQDVSGYTPEEREAVNLLDNHLGEQSSWDEERFVERMTALQAADFILPDIGFDLSGLEGLAQSDPPAAPPTGEMADTDFQYVDRYGVVVECKDEAEQRALFERLRDEGLDVKVVTV